MLERSEKSLEKVLFKNIKPVIDETMQKYLGITIEELNKDISDKIQTTPLISYDIDTNLSFKAAKKLFKKDFITKLIKTNLGNVSKVAEILHLNRRSIHRSISDLKIDIKQARDKMLLPKYYQKETVDNILKNTLDSYKEVIHPSKLTNVYSHVSTLSEDILKHIPIQEMTWKQAEKEFEKIFIKKALEQNNMSISKTSKKIKIRYETLIRKIKSLNIRKFYKPTEVLENHV